MSPRLFSAFALSLATLVAGAAHAAEPVKTENGVLVDAKGMTLYTFDKDSGGKSVCNGPCAKAWPPLLAEEDAKPAGEFSVITRDDGSKQWAYQDKPIYLYEKDKKPGDMTGDNFKDVWHVIKP